MIFSIYKEAFDALLKRPIRLWGISLLCGLLSILAASAFAVLPAVAYAINLLLTAGMTMIYLTFYRTRVEPKATDLFYSFKKERIVRVAGGLAWKDLWIFLWALIPVGGMCLVAFICYVCSLPLYIALLPIGTIVFAIIRSYEYRFTSYILLTREDVSTTDAIKISKKETMGLKGKMFWADVLICLMFCAASLVLGLFGQIPYIGVLFDLVNYVVTLLFYLLFPLFIGLVQAAFYEHAQAALAAPEAPETSTENTPAE